MKLITQFELAALSVPELHSLHRKVEAGFQATASGSTERMNALASLQNIKREIALRPPRP